MKISYCLTIQQCHCGEINREISLKLICRKSLVIPFLCFCSIVNKKGFPLLFKSFQWELDDITMNYWSYLKANSLIFTVEKSPSFEICFLSNDVEYIWAWSKNIQNNFGDMIISIPQKVTTLLFVSLITLFIPRIVFANHWEKFLLLWGTLRKCDKKNFDFFKVS